ncbi:MAG: hypothetical protein ACKOFM_00135 [Actinomycetota bacterium]
MLIEQTLVVTCLGKVDASRMWRVNEQRPLSALPSVLARAIAFGSVLVAGLAGALIGFTLVDLQCEGACDVPNAIGLVIGAGTGALGMGVVAVLVLRAVGEWKELEDKQ